MKIITLDAPLNFDNETFRCSSWGKLIGSGRGKNDMQKYIELEKKINQNEADLLATPENKRHLKLFQNLTDKLVEQKKKLKELEKTKDVIILSDIAKSYLIEIYCQKRDGIKKDIYSKYFEKGKAVEEESIEMLSELHEKFYIKNTIRKKNEFIEGECDIDFNQEKTVIDLKNAWNRFTFQAKTLMTIEDLEIYEWQGIGYCELFGAELFILVFALMNMPINLQKSEIQNILYKFGKDMENSPEFQDAIGEFQKQCNFDHLPLRERFFDKLRFKYDRSKYLEGVRYVKAARQWLNEYSICEYNRVNGILEVEDVKQEDFEVIEEIGEITQKDFDALFKPTSEHEKDLEEEIEDSFNGTITKKTIETINEIEEAEILSEELHNDSHEQPQEEIDEIEEAEMEEENSIDLDMIYQTIEKINTIEELKSYFNEFDSNFIAENQEVSQWFNNRDLEIQNKQSSTTSNTNDAFSPFQAKIDSCKTTEDCIKLYNELRPNFVEFPQIKTLLTERKNNLKPNEEVEVEKKQEKVEKPIKTPKPIKEEKPKENLVDEASEVNSKTEEILKEVYECKTPDEVRVIVKKYLENINDARYRTLRKSINDYGNSLDGK